jgi:16S rRNA (guanine527-N7)-methyltransferase
VAPALPTRIAERSALAGVAIPPDTLPKLQAYIELLARWNRRINLTALTLEPPTDEAIDRLLIEPLVAAKHVDPGDRLAVDVGSGGGSPAIPLTLASRDLRMVMVESRVKKSAFLREAVRALGLAGVEVVNSRLEEVAARADLHASVDLVTIRAVAPSDDLWGDICGLLRPGGRIFWFGGPAEASGPAGVPRVETVPTPPASRLVISQVSP